MSYSRFAARLAYPLHDIATHGLVYMELLCPVELDNVLKCPGVTVKEVLIFLCIIGFIRFL
jgi:hypothetical protein